MSNKGEIPTENGQFKRTLNCRSYLGPGNWGVVWGNLVLRWGDQGGASQLFVYSLQVLWAIELFQTNSMEM